MAGAAGGGGIPGAEPRPTNPARPTRSPIAT